MEHCIIEDIYNFRTSTSYTYISAIRLAIELKLLLGYNKDNVIKICMCISK